MSKIIFYGAISMDGYLATINDDLQWLFDTPTGEKTTYDAFYQTIDTTIMGRKTYQEAKKYLDTAKIYPEKTNYVFSTDKELKLEDARVVHEDPVSFIKELKESSEQRIWVVGGGRLLKPIIEQQLIDEWYIQIAPVLLGKGIRLFQEGDYVQRYQLVDTKRFGEFIELHYRKEGHKE
ncbi:dihydrofolate reductase family protein [Enterococcus mundtii]|uniref:dihydrofolate reductase family protein n=1 Tax=Enterococcus TaxID=1350 RepID=UPI000E06AA1A|nr:MULTISPECIES: dihydrofolate reductase family protein [Enterococcus]MDB7086082.1 dihydrofolate reductase family protein [Enterococcus mundtii]STD25484.1 reductase [Enterococcus mundtii]